MLRFKIILALTCMVSCNNETQIVQSANHGGATAIGVGAGQIPGSTAGTVQTPGSSTGEPTPINPGGPLIISPPVTTAPLPQTQPINPPPASQEVGLEDINLNSIGYTKTPAEVPGVCNSESFNAMANILFRSSTSQVVVTNVTEFMKAYQDEAIIILANDIDLTGLKALPKARHSQHLIYGNHHTIKNYDSDRTLFFDTTTALFCHLKIDQIKVHADRNTVDTWFGGLFRRSRIHSYDVRYSNFDILIPQTIQGISLAGAITGSCINNSLEKVVLENIQLVNNASAISSLGGVCGSLSLNYGPFEGVWDSQFNNVTVKAKQAHAGVVYGGIRGRHNLGTSQGNDIRAINIKFNNNSVEYVGLGGEYASGGEFAGDTSGPTDMKNIQSKNFKLTVTSTRNSGAGGLLGSISTSFDNDRMKFENIRYEQLQLKNQSPLTDSGGLIGKCRSSYVSIQNSFVSGSAVIQTTSTSSRSGKFSGCASSVEQNNQGNGFVIR